MPFTQFTVEPIVSPAIIGRHNDPAPGKLFVIRVAYGVTVHVFRYAYVSEEQALEVACRLRDGFGQPAGIPTDLAANYWPLKYMSWARNREYFAFTQRTTQKNSWYVQEPQWSPLW